MEPAYEALMEGGSASLSLPVTGRIAVAVYLAVNGAEPKLEVQQVDMKDINGKRTPVINARNIGDAHGRLKGGLEGIKFDLLPRARPSAGPNHTWPWSATRSASVRTGWPVTSKGRINWEKGSFKIDAEFDQ